MQNIRFSVLMPTFNRPTFLRKAVEAVLAQTYQNWQLIIKEGGDKAVFNTLDGLDLSKITLIYSKDNGITDAMNQAMRISNGDVFIWANDDDLLEPTALETIVNNIGDHEWGFAKMITSNGTVCGCPCDIEGLKKGNLICQPTVFWTRHAFTVLGDMNEELDLVSDYDYWVRLMKEFKPVFIDQVIARYTIHPNQTTQVQAAVQSKQASIVRSLI